MHNHTYIHSTHIFRINVCDDSYTINVLHVIDIFCFRQPPPCMHGTKMYNKTYEQPSI